jgi:phosphoglycerate dehydrogenase-like enzyme
LGALLSDDRVLATAALAAETKDARERTAAQAAEQVLIFVNTGLKRETLN